MICNILQPPKFRAHPDYITFQKVKNGPNPLACHLRIFQIMISVHLARYEAWGNFSFIYRWNK